MDIDKNIIELRENGYTIIHNIFNKDEIHEYRDEFFKWYKSAYDVEYLHSIIHSNGIFKYFQVGHQRFAWIARTNPKVLDVFKQLWSCNELVCSFDGCCHYPRNYEGEQSYWMHTDQSSRKKGIKCFQSFLSLTDNSERTLVLLKGSHLRHEKYFEDMKIDEPSDWHVLNQDYIKDLIEELDLVHLDVSAGDLVIWDSRVFHQNTCGTLSCEEERLIQYLCYLPKNSEGNNELEKERRKIYFDNRRTTNHWPYPMRTVPEQPDYYNYHNPDYPIIIDYNKFLPPNLEDLMPRIKRLL
jgi:hypothetical protein